MVRLLAAEGALMTESLSVTQAPTRPDRNREERTSGETP